MVLRHKAGPTSVIKEPVNVDGFLALLALEDGARLLLRVCCEGKCRHQHSSIPQHHCYSGKWNHLIPKLNSQPLHLWCPVHKPSSTEWMPRLQEALGIPDEH